MLRKFGNLGRLAGVDAVGFARYVSGIPRFLRDVRTYKKSLKPNYRFQFYWKSAKPLTGYYYDTAGTASGHYFSQDLWASRAIFKMRPATHIDIGSRVDGFVSNVLTFMPVTVIDIRPMKSHVDGLTFLQEDATEMSKFEDNSVESISCLHAMEHFGLGRYGDPIDADSCFKGMRSLARVLKPEGRLYFSVPSGRERLEFNAHRVFYPDTVLEAFEALKLVSFSAVTDDNQFVPSTTPKLIQDAHFACGMFEFTK